LEITNRLFKTTQALISLNSKNDKDYKTGDLYWLLDQPEKADSAFQQAASILLALKPKSTT
jgi:hypothetical protein